MSACKLGEDGHTCRLKTRDNQLETRTLPLTETENTASRTGEALPLAEA